MQVNLNEAKLQLSRLLELVQEGEEIVITRNGQAVAELVPARRSGGFPFDAARAQPLASAGDGWWRAMTDGEAEDWAAGR